MEAKYAKSVWGLDVSKKKWACVKLWMDEKDEIQAISAEPMAYLPQPELTLDCLLAIADVPIGLLDDCKAKKSQKGNVVGRRSVDEGAKQWCLSHGSTSDPPTVLQYESGILEHARAAAAPKGKKRRVLGNVKPDGLSCQSLEMIPAIQSAERLKKKHPDRLYESHPEVAFAAVVEGILPFNKKSLTGSLARALCLSRRLGLDIVRWVIKQESKTKIKADDWLDALAMAVVAYDWREKDNRWMLSSKNGAPEKWNGQADHLIALPLTSLRNVPEKLCAKKVGRMVMASQRRVQSREKAKRRPSERASLQG